jgi:hypothetical protein
MEDVLPALPRCLPSCLGVTSPAWLLRSYLLCGGSSVLRPAPKAPAGRCRALVAGVRSARRTWLAIIMPSSTAEDTTGQSGGHGGGFT